MDTPKAEQNVIKETIIQMLQKVTTVHKMEKEQNINFQMINVKYIM